MDTPAQSLHWGFILISQPNFFMIVGMILVFILALLAPFPGRRAHQDEPR